MKIHLAGYNTYLLWLLCAAAAGGCKTADTDSTEMKKNETCVLRLHLETNPDGTDKTVPVPISRLSPFTITVEKEFFLAEPRLAAAELAEDGLGGFLIKVQFDRQGTWLLEQYTAANKGRRIAVFSEFGELRWLAAPRINRTISDGVFMFTPDASREEAERIVQGLRNAIRKERGKNTLNEPAPK